MQQIISLLYKGIKRLFRVLRFTINHVYTVIIFYLNNVEFSNIQTKGVPFISIAKGGRFLIGNNLSMNNGLNGNPIGRPQPCVFFVDKDAVLKIGNHVGISATALIAHKSITIGNHVKIGGGVCIYDTDFHSLNAGNRSNRKMDRENENKLPVNIEDNVFIGAHSTILKGVNIGENSIIGACSVVTKSVPANEIWAGNPARFIKSI
jgi:acetyltransferase-like isoleucine patch superfamily enzyme